MLLVAPITLSNVEVPSSETVAHIQNESHECGKLLRSWMHQKLLHKFGVIQYWIAKDENIVDTILQS